MATCDWGWSAWAEGVCCAGGEAERPPSRARRMSAARPSSASASPALASLTPARTTPITLAETACYALLSSLHGSPAQTMGLLSFLAGYQAPGRESPPSAIDQSLSKARTCVCVRLVWSLGAVRWDERLRRRWHRGIREGAVHNVPVPLHPFAPVVLQQHFQAMAAVYTNTW